ncbi:MAG: RNA polymerase sigma-70 factor [Bacteroidia bacterium]|jgi:RNA polymerase sigma-70 factor (ECF subfamily)|nr:RNA polymerase sigma-70 factor [Bacteroidia bacterium]
MKKYPEQLLAQLIKDGDEKAFEFAYSLYVPDLIDYAFTILKDMGEAEDVVQQLFVQLWLDKATIMIHTTLKGYLYKSVQHRSLNKIKQRNVRTSHALFVQNNSWQVTEKSAADVAENNELQKALHTAINNLPELTKSVFTLAKFEQKKYIEISEQLNIPVKTVENQMGKALKLLRNNLKHFLPLFLLHIILPTLGK